MRVIAYKLCIWALVAPAMVRLAQAQGSLPVEVQADLLKTEIVSAVDKKDSAKVLAGISRYHELGTPLPAALLFLEARYSAKDSPRRAKAALMEFFQTAPRDNPNYPEALQLYRDVSTRVLEPTIRDLYSSMQFVSIPAGLLTYQGNNVTIRQFRVLARPITLEQIQMFYDAETGGHTPDKQTLGWAPVTWEMTQEFIAWLNKNGPRRFRMPTEAEWEFAARGGAADENFPPPTALSQRDPPTVNSYGVYFAVSEWVADCYHESFSSAPPDGSAWLEGCENVPDEQSNYEGPLPGTQNNNESVMKFFTALRASPDAVLYKKYHSIASSAPKRLQRLDLRRVGGQRLRSAKNRWDRAGFRLIEVQ